MAKIDGMPVFVHGAVPGQKVEGEITKKSDRFAEARTIKVLQHAVDEIQPRCKHCAECGGCAWQNLSYEKQIIYKEEIVRETLEHVTPVDEKIRKTLPGRVLALIPSPQVFYYRNKLEFSFGNNTAAQQADIGFKRPGQREEILPIEECHLYDEQLSALLSHVRKFLIESRMPIVHASSRKGILRSLLLRRGIQTGEQMVCFFVQAKKKQLEPLFEHFVRFGRNPSVTSLLVVEHFGHERPGVAGNPSFAKATGGRPVIYPLKGEPFIRERLFDLTFELSPFSFFQTNTLAAEKLFQTVAKMAELRGRETVLDCYCGIGAIGQYLARHAEKVIGVESSAPAIEDALKSAGKNRISNISFFRGAAESVLQKQLKPGGKYAFNCIILNPPRAGLHPAVIDATLSHQPEKIIYVSCNTSTFARDLGAFLTHGYDLRMVQPVDLFPHTPHVETVALLQRA